MIRHIKRVLIVFLTLAISISCHNNASSQKIPTSFEEIRELKIINSQKEELNIRLAIGPYEISLGLSGVQPDQFKENQGLFFFFLDERERLFWMPDTYFNLDIFFLDDKLRILHIVRNIQAHPGRSENPPIPRAPIIKSRYVLEIRANAPFGKNLKVDEKIFLKSEFSLENIEKFILKNYF